MQRTNKGATHRDAMKEASVTWPKEKVKIQNKQKRDEKSNPENPLHKNIKKTKRPRFLSESCLVERSFSIFSTEREQTVCILPPPQKLQKDRRD